MSRTPDVGIFGNLTDQLRSVLRGKDAGAEARESRGGTACKRTPLIKPLCDDRLLQLLAGPGDVTEQLVVHRLVGVVRGHIDGPVLEVVAQIVKVAQHVAGDKPGKLVIRSSTCTARSTTDGTIHLAGSP